VCVAAGGAFGAIAGVLRPFVRGSMVAAPLAVLPTRTAPLWCATATDLALGGDAIRRALSTFAPLVLSRDAPGVVATRDGVASFVLAESAVRLAVLSPTEATMGCPPRGASVAGAAGFRAYRCTPNTAAATTASVRTAILTVRALERADTAGVTPSAATRD